MIYLLLAIAATTIGTLVGVGGGFIIRPLLNLLDVSKGLASFTSSITVFSMAVTNLILYKKQGNKLQLNNIVYMGIGGIIGGLVGGSLMAYVPEQIINSLYLAAILVMLGSVIAREHMDLKPVTNPAVKVILGACCGMLSSFFGIGGGPFLMTVLLVFLALDPKEAAIQSILITLLTTSSSMVRYTISGYMDFSLAIYCIPGGIMGGFLGRAVTKRVSSKTVRAMFYIVLVAIMAVQIYTVFTGGK